MEILYKIFSRNLSSYLWIEYKIYSLKSDLIKYSSILFQDYNTFLLCNYLKATNVEFYSFVLFDQRKVTCFNLQKGVRKRTVKGRDYSLLLFINSLIFKLSLTVHCSLLIMGAK